MEGHNEPGDAAELERLRAKVAELEQQAERGEQEVEQARVAAADARAAKSQFLATMSHELRTPLNAIDGYAELMQLGVYGPLTEQQRRALDRLRQAQKRLLSLVNDVLSFAQLEAGSRSVDAADVEVGELFATVQSIMAPQLSARSQTLSIDMPPPGLCVRADRDGAEQILLNLVANATKYSTEGGRIHLAAVAGDPIHIHVTDWGSGIPGDRLEGIFEPFVQLTGGIIRDHAGVGLGLSISRELARAMGGDIEVRSQPGLGSTFTLALPASRDGDGDGGGDSAGG